MRNMLTIVGASFYASEGNDARAGVTGQKLSSSRRTAVNRGVAEPGFPKNMNLNGKRPTTGRSASGLARDSANRYPPL